MTYRPDDAPLAELASDKYLNYALSVITSRALPDIRDGLKPVQRRILFAMFHDLHLNPDAKAKKSAKVVGEVMGSYHPHGDQSIYDAMVRLAQDFATRYPLVDGQGNFGSLDGDPPAAMRYTEVKLRHVAMELLDELKQETVDFHATYDGTRTEPDVLPAMVPNLLINGVSGIAVGVATNIPPHNLREVVDAAIELVDDRSVPLSKLLKHVKGPDFPTGGTILNSADELAQIYATGSGTVKVRGTWVVEKDGRRTNLVITSIPYAVDKSVLVARIGELIGAREVPQLTDVRDESTEEVRVVCELKAGASAEAAAAYLFKNTTLQNNFHVNFTCLVPGAGVTAASQAAADRTKGVSVDAEAAAAGLVPLRVDLKTTLEAFLDFRMVIVTRRHKYELKKLLEKLHILEGFEKIFADLDRAIKIVRNADGKADAFVGLKKAFALSDLQAEAVLETKLYKLSKLEIKDIQKELAITRKRVAEIEKILASEKVRWKIVRDELLEVKDAYGDPRRTTITGPVQEVEFRAEEYIIDEDAWVVVTRDGWIKRQKRFGEVSTIRVREGDKVGWLYRSGARHCVTFFGNRGSAYTMRAADVPMTSGHGEPLGRYFSLGDGELIIGVVSHDPRCLPEAAPADLAKLVGSAVPAPDEGQGKLFAGGVKAAKPVAPSVDPAPSESADEGGSRDVPPGPYALAVTRLGKALRFPLAIHGEPSTKNGRLYGRLAADFPADQIVTVEVTGGGEMVCLASLQARVLVFSADEVPVLSGPGRGVIALKLDEGDRIVGALLARSPGDGLVMETSRGTTLDVKPSKFKGGKRAAKGTVAFARTQLIRAVPPDAVPVPDVSQIKDEGEDDGGAGSPSDGGGTHG